MIIMMMKKMGFNVQADQSDYTFKQFLLKTGRSIEPILLMKRSFDKSFTFC